MKNTENITGHTDGPLQLEALSHMNQATFTRELANIFEHSPWVAERAWNRRPFASLDALHAAMVDVVDQASDAEKLALIRAHPELAGKQAREGTLTDASAQEQRGAGLDACSADELARLNSLNSRYRDRFGFPFIIAVKGLDRHQIMDAMQARLSNSPEQEIHTCLAEIGKIACFRLEALFSA
ncbi:MAG TPA: 2-oxo-4-hydroxy-4-carboxy-5-ureidoimidazoline decarboxylase [Burkholderiaceae bacterium]|nr:2-oxo-4-hydroxy-4-carboxy-5-ureidoimidazoline decarboxylase [Burkholderiaceae bacterium]